METSLQLKWMRDPAGYDVVYRAAEVAPDEGARTTILGDADLREAGFYVVPRSGKLEPYVLNGTHREAPVSMALVNASFNRSGERAGIKDFADRWGLLRWHDDTELDDFHRAIDYIWRMIYLVRYKPSDLATQMPSLRGVRDQLLPDGTVLRKPNTLLTYCLCELNQVINSGSEFKVCDYCSNYFVGKHRTGKRKERRWFCPDPNHRCRKQFHRKGMKEARAADDATRRGLSI